MDKIDKYFNEYKKMDKNIKTGEDFLLSVHKKIVRKKKNRKNVFVVLCISVLTAFVYLVLPQNNSINEKYIAGIQETNRSADNKRFKKLVRVKQEVPLLENLSFSTYDENVEYGVEKINYVEGNSI